MLTAILTGAPIWVWPLLVLMITLGLIASKGRSRSYIPIYFFWLLGFLSLNAVNGLTPAPVIWGIFGVAYLLGAAFGYRFQGRIIISKSGGRITLKGEWLSMNVLMTIFWMNFVGGVVQAISPEAYASTGFHALFAVVAGLASGTFIGRALRVFITPSMPEPAIA
uniref:DUF1453 domain-containing protein n=1 Tax=endosymbiont of Ridgeia piscesae TaxID=54398 RepID=D2CL00_9GAMM|nr:hypothetical protein [endosymbiont of Ridgeia piscesae]